MEISNLDIRDISIIDALPVYNCPKEIFTVGAGQGRLEWHLSNMGYKIIASDINKSIKWKENENLKFVFYNILNYEKKNASIVICSQVLEHLKDYKTAFKNLINHTQARLIITFPHKYAFHSPEHINFWNNRTVKIFETMAMPYSTSISKIRTKPEDKQGNKFVYLLIIDKRQKYA